MKRTLVTMIYSGVILLLVACAGQRAAAPAGSQSVATPLAQESDRTPVETTDAGDTLARPAGWSQASHSNEAGPDYEIVFPEDEVQQLTITIAPEDWEAMQANMTQLFGEQGSGAGPGGRGMDQPPGEFRPPPGGEAPEGFELPEGFEPPAGGQFPQDGQPPAGVGPGQGARGPGGPGMGGGDFTSENPVWVEATIEFDGQTWTHVGVRYKGNSSLRSAWDSGTLKIPFKLDFDEFEDDYPEIDDQRFYGFKQLSLANGFGDATYMRDTITYDLLEEAGLVAAETAYYQVLLDYGEGPLSLGLYTMIEVIDDTVVERAFGGDAGNIYEGDGPAASFAEGTFDQIESSFQKENHEEEADYSDLEALYRVLHSEQRTADAAAWRENLEAVFDVDTFLEWLALSSVLQHWDSYGMMSHNYYLYNDPDTGRLTWISWDHNLVLGGLGGAGRARDSGTMDKANVSENWPLIRYLLDDPVYYEAYVGYLEATALLFNPERMEGRYQELAQLLAPNVEDAAVFTEAVQELTELTYERYEALQAFLGQW